MYERITDRARKAMALANQEAQRLSHKYIGTEHILLGLVKEGSGVGTHVLKSLGVDLRKVRLEVEKMVKAAPEVITMGGLPQTPRAQKVIEYAVEEARGLHHNYLGTEHLLLGLIRERDGVAARVLHALGVDLERVRRAVVQPPGSTAALDTRAGTPAENDEGLSTGCDMCARIDRIRRGDFPGLIAELDETYTILGENQGCRGWCVLYLKGHREHLSELDAARQSRIFGDVALVAQAIRTIVNPRRINYECLGNVVPHIHWHIIPRHEDDPEPTKPVWGWSAERLRGTMSDAERAELIESLRRAIR